MDKMLPMFKYIYEKYKESPDYLVGIDLRDLDNRNLFDQTQQYLFSKGYAKPGPNALNYNSIVLYPEGVSFLEDVLSSD